MSDNLRSIQLTGLSIFKAILELMKRHNIDYFVLGGTLLGSVRHHGFIPWDDDIDIGIPRPDYDRFMQIAEQELKSPFSLYTFNNGRRVSGIYFAQVANESVTFKRNYGGKTVESHVCVDVFPLDGVPEGNFRFSIWKNKNMLISKLFSLSQVRNLYDVNGSPDQWKTKKDKFIRTVLTLRLDKLLNSKKLWNALDRNLRKIDYNSSSRLINFCGCWRMKEMFDKKVYGNGAMYEFEDIMVRGPEDFDFVLTQMYGDYMTPPSNSELNHHNIVLDE